MRPKVVNIGRYLWQVKRNGQETSVEPFRSWLAAMHWAVNFCN